MPQFPFKWPPVTQIVAVVCIVGFLAIVLYPVFHVVHRRDGRFTCVSDMKQLGLAYAQYEQNGDDTFPAGVNTAGNGWAGQLYPYVKSQSVYHCPDDAHDGLFISYTENRNLAGIGYGKLTNPAATVAVYEFSTLNCDPSMPEAVSAADTSAPRDSTRHDAATFGLNFLMADGSTKWLLPAQVSNGPGAISPKALPSGKMVRTFAVR